MMNIPLTSLDTYKKLIEDLEQLKQPIEITKVLEILSVRDALQVELEQQPISIDRLQLVIELDARLRANASRIIAEIDKNKGKEFVHWRESIQPSDEAWWWHLDMIDSPAPEERFDWLWKGLSIGAWAANISLAINIASRFGGAGGVGFFDPMPTILLAIGGFIKAGGNLPRVEKLLKKIRIPNPDGEWTKLLAAMMVLGILGSCVYSIPLVSKIYNIHGRDKFDDPDHSDFSEAEKEYKRAISLDGHNTDAHFNLGNLYEELKDIAKAKQQYEIAIADKSISAHNNLGHLYIQEKKYSRAVELLSKGLAYAENPENLKIKPEIKYSLYKNLGWARLKQGRYEEAQEKLIKANNITENVEAERSIPNPGAAHCLLAQTLEQLKKPKIDSLKQWIQCNESGFKPNKGIEGEEDDWLFLAKQKLSKHKNTLDKK
jgi:tetratricopeptide (TPR) repeat protein